MDLSMPEMDGWMAAEKLKADESTKSIPLYALSAHTLPSDRKRALDAGCDGYISKPIHMAGFLDVVERAFAKKEKKARKSRETI
jgi:CheY-like chemotaxis protein